MNHRQYHHRLDKRLYYRLSDDEEECFKSTNKEINVAIVEERSSPLGMTVRLGENPESPRKQSAAAAAIALALSFEENEDCYLTEDEDEDKKKENKDIANIDHNSFYEPVEIRLKTVNAHTPYHSETNPSGSLWIGDWNAGSIAASHSSLSSSSSSSSSSSKGRRATAEEKALESENDTDLAALPLLHATDDALDWYDDSSVLLERILMGGQPESNDSFGTLENRPMIQSVSEDSFGGPTRSTSPTQPIVSFDSIWNEIDGEETSFDWNTTSPFALTKDTVFGKTDAVKPTQQHWMESLFPMDFGIDGLEDYTNDGYHQQQSIETQSDDDETVEDYFSTYEIPFGNNCEQNETNTDTADVVITTVNEVQSPSAAVEEGRLEAFPIASTCRKNVRFSERSLKSLQRKRSQRTAKWCLWIIIGVSVVVVCCIIVSFVILHKMTADR